MGPVVRTWRALCQRTGGAVPVAQQPGRHLIQRPRAPAQTSAQGAGGTVAADSTARFRILAFGCGWLSILSRTALRLAAGRAVCPGSVCTPTPKPQKRSFDAAGQTHAGANCYSPV